MILWIILIPLLGAAFNGLLFVSGLWRKVLKGGEHTEKKIASLVGCGVVLASALISTSLFIELLSMEPGQRRIIQELFVWIPSGSFTVSFDFLFDTLSCIMALVITWIGFLIHVYSTGYMHDDRAYAKYFMYLNIFIFFMLTLVLGNSFPLMFVGWEGVGLASYLLIGFWYENPDNADAGRKAFVVNRIGDFGFLLGIFLIFFVFGSVGYQEVFGKALDPVFMSGVPAAAITAIALLLFVGAVGKSAQIPLYVWLPDAMAGPTPVSALIHAATMVTAGAYMVARCSAIFSQSATAQMIIVTVAVLTSFLAATIALTQNDIKKVLAYSTISQLGYMFMGIGVGAYTAGLFHLVTHAFFKALLFLGSGSVIHALSGEQDIRRMGGLRKHIPTTAITFLIGTLAIAGVPLLSGFFSKDGILGQVYDRGYALHWLLALITVVLTALYMFRLYLLTFEGKTRMTDEVRHHVHESPFSMTIPLVILAVLSIFGGYIGVPEFMGELVGIHGSNLFDKFVSPAILLDNFVAAGHHLLDHVTLLVLSIAAAATGIVIAFYLYSVKPGTADRIAANKSVEPFYNFSYNKWYVDELYDYIIVQPFRYLSNLAAWFDTKFIDGAVNGVAHILKEAALTLEAAQTGVLRSYATLMAIGALAILVFVVLWQKF
ncbi:MAG: NADH-quinone oxidoreductase subunit L [Candidatus Dadabacteria bacterium]|nr:NADH-quinone oxidoreductase subunit L [Candidatus Dadabacteria bacterium]